MNDGDRQRAALVRELFDEVADLDDAARATWLQERGVDDGEVLAELDALVAADRQTGDPPVLSPHWLERLSAAATSRVGQRAGDYRLTELLGSGGMGDVYLAERDAGDFDQKVAIKLVRRDLVSAAVTRRFTEERRILARLRHPAIATMFGGGLTDDGRPYLVMEYVDGVPLDQHCAERDLPRARRIALVIAVCHAVAHAHARRTVHCDLKPDNVLVTADGEVKLLDFGIATALEDDDAGPPTALTPTYAAPEVLDGQAPSTAADVFSLGVLLYRVLAGTLPHPAHDGDLAARARMLRVTVPPSLGSADLDAICRRAMAPAPEDRYPSVAALADDLERALSHRPVEARRRTWRYVAGRFVRRHTAATAVAALVTVAIALLVGFYTRRLADERDRARAEAARARAVSDVAAGMLTVVDPSEVRGAPLAASELLRRAERHVDDGLAAYPVEQEHLQQVLAEVHNSLGSYADAERLARVALAGARRRGDAAVVAERLRVLGEALHQEDQLDDAEAAMREALALTEAGAGADSLDAAAAQLDLSAVLHDTGAYDEALALAEHALATYRARGVGPADLATALGAVEVLYLVRGDDALAEPVAREAVAASIAGNGEVHPMTAALDVDLGDALRHLGRYDDAEPFYREALEVRRTLYPGDNADVAHSLNHLARLVQQKGDPAAAEPLYREGLAMRRRLYPDGEAEVAASLGGLAKDLVALDRVDEALPLMREAYEMMRRLYGDDHPYTSASLASYAEIVDRSGDRGEAVRLYREALALARRNNAPDDFGLAGPTLGLGEVLCRGDAAERTEGRGLLSAAAALYAARVPADHPQRRAIAATLAACADAPAR
ncbi:MAG: serine/threonine protein kinase [Kofleriaceae bacterium]|nr:serine/threonine protein kinase [Kofleriaceae bacterium]MCB9570826.1 serine/threonine protein kinase [Kofleriaceae bacterium]